VCSALAERGRVVARELGDAARLDPGEVLHRGGDPGFPAARVRREVVAQGDLIVVIESHLRERLDHRRHRHGHVLDGLAERLAQGRRHLIDADRGRPGQRVRLACVRRRVREDRRDARPDVANVDHRELCVAEGEVDRALLGDRLRGHHQVLHEEVRLHDGERETASGDLRVREGVQTAVEVRRIVRGADRGHPHHVLHPAKPRRPERIRRLDRRTRPGRREQPRDIDALERPLDGAEEQQIAGTQLDALGREVLGLGRVANETDQAMAGALQGSDHGGGDIAGRTGEKDRGHADTIAPRSGLHNGPPRSTLTTRWDGLPVAMERKVTLSATSQCKCRSYCLEYQHLKGVADERGRLDACRLLY